MNKKKLILISIMVAAMLSLPVARSMAPGSAGTLPELDRLIAGVDPGGGQGGGGGG